jgi:hypothetical protein
MEPSVVTSEEISSDFWPIHVLLPKMEGGYLQSCHCNLALESGRP